MKKLLLLLLLLPSAAFADFKDWTLQNQRLYASGVTLHAMDIMQTFALVECQQRNSYCPYYERNPILGTHPTKGEIVVASLIFELINYKMLNSKRLNSRQRRNALIIINAIGILPILNNQQIGLGIYIPIIPYRQFINK